MKRFIDIYLKWLVLGFWFMSIVFVGYLAIKARNSSSSWVTVDSSTPAALYVGENETLTAAKRNRLVQNAVWEEVPTTNTDAFDINCDRKWQRDETTTDNIFYANNVRAWDWSRINCSTAAYDFYVDKGSKWLTKYSASSRPNLHIRKKCR